MTDSRPRIGDLAPDFSLPATADENVTLSSFRGGKKVLLAFFPLAFTGTCTAEMCGFTDDYDAFATADTAVFGVSVDSVPTLKEFRRKHQIQIDMLSDFKREVSKKYGTLLEGPYFSDRAYFIIDRDGILRWTHFEDDLGEKRDNSELLAELAKTS